MVSQGPYGPKEQEGTATRAVPFKEILLKIQLKLWQLLRSQIGQTVIERFIGLHNTILDHDDRDIAIADAYGGHEHILVALWMVR